MRSVVIQGLCFSLVFARSKPLRSKSLPSSVRASCLPAPTPPPSCRRSSFHSFVSLSVLTGFLRFGALQHSVFLRKTSPLPLTPTHSNPLLRALRSRRLVPHNHTRPLLFRAKAWPSLCSTQRHGHQPNPQTQCKNKAVHVMAYLETHSQAIRIAPLYSFSSVQACAPPWSIGARRLSLSA